MSLPPLAYALASFVIGAVLVPLLVYIYYYFKDRDAPDSKITLPTSTPVLVSRHDSENSRRVYLATAGSMLGYYYDEELDIRLHERGRKPDAWNDYDMTESTSARGLWVTQRHAIERGAKPWRESRFSFKRP